MKTMIKKILFSDRKSFLLMLAVILVAIFTIIISIYANSIDKKNNTLKTRLAEIQSLSGKLIRIKSITESKEKKIGLTKVTGVVSALEQILNSLRLEAKVIKPLEKKRIKEFIEEEAELEIQGIDLNSIVNLLYKIDNSPVPMKIKSAAIKTTFENPDTFILKLTASLISMA